MKFLITATAIVLALLAAPSRQATAGVAVSVSEPGFFGQIDIGGYPPPQVIYPEPVIIQRSNVGYPPIYLRVPPGHIKRWNRYCHEYNACGRPVYFVHDNWYHDVYVPRYREYHRGPHEYPRPEHREYREYNEHREHRDWQHGERERGYER